MSIKPVQDKVPHSWGQVEDDVPYVVTEVRMTDPETGGQKGVKLQRYDLVPFDALDELATVYGVGAQKYEDNNYLKGYKYSYSLGALLRHVSLWAQGEDYDNGLNGTGRHHLACAAWHCLTLMTFQFRKLGTDDRKKSK